MRQEVVRVKARGLKALKQRLSAMSHLRSFAKNDPGPGTTSYKLEEDARRFVGAELGSALQEVAPVSSTARDRAGERRACQGVWGCRYVDTEESSTIVSMKSPRWGRGRRPTGGGVSRSSRSSTCPSPRTTASSRRSRLSQYLIRRGRRLPGMWMTIYLRGRAMTP